ncbi:Hpt domain-containing protein [uncultured Sulfitobacter sp.]|uniref:Hpt domain-containing protein n=1 Tax=uncultured Sulfitobacter sp. TaxID=191468 RepID=UPI00262C8EED|nr:Hpt domain-containing protein [uncultured Sulfitobacter sp.]
MSEFTKSDEAAHSFEAGIARIRDRFIAQLPERVSELDGLLDDLYENEDFKEPVTGIRNIAHKLHGQAGCFGFAELGQIAAKLEEQADLVIEAQGPLDTENVEAYLVLLLDQIEERLAAA